MLYFIWELHILGLGSSQIYAEHKIFLNSLSLLPWRLCMLRQHCPIHKVIYRKVSNISRTLVRNKIGDHSDVRLHSQLNTWLQWIRQIRLQDATRNIPVLGFGATYIRELTVISCFLPWCDTLKTSSGKWWPFCLTTFSCAFSWMKMYKSRLKFHSTLFPKVQLTTF